MSASEQAIHRMVLKPHAARSAVLVACLAAGAAGAGWLAAPEERSLWLTLAVIAPGLWAFFEIKGRILGRAWGPGTRLEILRRAYGTIVSGAGVASAVFAAYSAASFAFDWRLGPDMVAPRYVVAVIGAFYVWWGNHVAKHVAWAPGWLLFAGANGRGAPANEAVLQQAGRAVGWLFVMAGAIAFIAAVVFPDPWLGALTRFGVLPLCVLACGRMLYARIRLMWSE